MDRSSILRKLVPWLGLLAGAALLVWVLRDLDLARFGDVIVTARPWPLLLLVVFVASDGLVRAEKWRHMLMPLASIARLRLFGAIMAGYFANILMPVRVSPLVRAWLVARLEGLRTGALLATVALDRSIDGVVFLGFAAIALVLLRFPTESDAVQSGVLWGSVVGAALLAVAFALLIAMRFGLARGLGGIMEYPVLRRLPRRWRDAAGDFFGDFGAGIVWPNSVWRGATIIGASIGLKLIQISYFVWAGLAFGVVLPFSAYLNLMVFLGFLAILAGMLRIVGGFTAGAIFALEAFGVETEIALAMTLVLQVAVHVSIVGIGLPALWLQGVNIRSLRTRFEEQGDGG